LNQPLQQQRDWKNQLNQDILTAEANKPVAK